jgi:hypothetical protein
MSVNRERINKSYIWCAKMSVPVSVRARPLADT